MVALGLLIAVQLCAAGNSGAAKTTEHVDVQSIWKPVVAELAANARAYALVYDEPDNEVRLDRSEIADEGLLVVHPLEVTAASADTVRATRVDDGVRGDAVRRVVLSDRGAAAGRRASLLRGRAVAGRRHGGPPTRGPHAVVARRSRRRGAPATPRHQADDAMLRGRTVGVLHENKDEAVA